MLHQNGGLKPLPFDGFSFACFIYLPARVRERDDPLFDVAYANENGFKHW